MFLLSIATGPFLPPSEELPELGRIRRKLLVVELAVKTIIKLISGTSSQKLKRYSLYFNHVTMQ